MRATPAAVEAAGNGHRLLVDVTCEVEGNERPACVAQLILQLVPAA